MESEHLSAQSVELYRRRVMSTAELLAADDHFAACEDCRRHAGEPLQMDAVVSALRANLRAGATVLDSDHLSYEQIAALVDDEIGVADREALESHLEVCALCTEEVNDLRAFRPEALAVSGRKSASAARPPLREKLWSFWPTTRPALRLSVTAALALLFVSASVALFFVWRGTRPAPPEVAESPSRAVGVEAPRAPAEASPDSKPDSSQGDTNSENIAPLPSPRPEVPADDSQIVLALNDGGGRVTLDASGNVGGLGSLPPSSRQAVKQALSTGLVEVPPGLSELMGTKGTLLGTTGQGPGFSLLSPVGTITRTGRPTLRWRPLSGATSYTVAVLDSDFNAMATSPPLTGTEWTPPHALERGRVYSWQVTAVKDGKEIISPSAPAPEARFKVLEKAKADELSEIEKGAVSHLARGTLYARAGLLDDAERELRALLAANPKSPTARKLLQSLQAIRRR
ncbi:MAG: hypothetical protein ND866_16335 [Pyrinomonadaceae bacterium]|nr:hypothetical protein [Pyrinomonadaceae bacterium]